MWRSGRRLLIPAVVFVLMAGLLVPAGAGPAKVPRPTWTLTQQYDASDYKVVTLKGTVPSNPKGNYSFTVRVDIGNACAWVNGGSSPSCLTAATPCLVCTRPPNGPESYELYFPDHATNGNSGTGWTIDAVLAKSGTLTITVVLTSDFLVGATQFISVGLTGLPLESGYPLIEASTRLEQAFQ